MRRSSPIVLALAALCLPVVRAGSDACLGVLLPLVRHRRARRLATSTGRSDGHAPPNDIASAYYPARGHLLVRRPARDRRSRWTRSSTAGIDEIAVSWWGRGSPEDPRLPAVIAAARARRHQRSRRTSSRTPAEPSRDGRRRRLPARLRHPHVLRLPRARSAGRRLGGRERGAARGGRRRCSRRRRSSARPRRPASTASTPTTSSSTAATSSRGSAAQAHAHAPALRAVGRARLRRAARQRRPDA